MCIAILNTSSLLSLETIENSMLNNPDGSGLLFVNEAGVLESFKTLTTDAKDFYSDYKYIRRLTNLPMVLHSRIGTHGKNDLANCHPFLLDNKIGFVHNGMLNNVKIYDKTKSDTFHLNKMLKKHNNYDDYFDGKTFASRALTTIVGGSNKLIFLNNEGRYAIYNKALGHVDSNKNWYSNNTYKTFTYTSKFYNYDWVK